MKRLLVAALLLVVCVASAAAQQPIVSATTALDQNISSEIAQDRSAAPAEDTSSQQPSFMNWS